MRGTPAGGWLPVAAATGVRPGPAEHLGVFLGRDAEVLDRDVDPDRVPPQVRLKSGRLVLGIEDELRDAPAEGPHRLVARRAEVAQIDTRDVERLRVRQTARREVVLQEVEGRGFDGGVRRGRRCRGRILGYGGKQRRRIVARWLVMLVVMKFLVMMVFGRDGLVMRMAQADRLFLIVVAAFVLAELVAVQRFLGRVVDGAMSAPAWPSCTRGIR